MGPVALRVKSLVTSSGRPAVVTEPASPVSSSLRDSRTRVPGRVQTHTDWPGLPARVQRALTLQTSGARYVRTFGPGPPPTP